MVSSNTFIDIAERFGVLAAFLFFFVIGASYGLYRLFGKKDGILTDAVKRITDRHLAFVDEVSAQGSRTLAVTETMAEAQASQAKSASRLTRAFEHHAEGMIVIARGISPETGKLVEEFMAKLKRELRGDA